MILWSALWRRRARRAARVENWPEAAAAYRRYLARRPRDAAAWVQLGHMTKESGELAAAADAYAAAAAITPARPDPWFQLGHVRLLSGDRAAGLAAFSRCLQEDPAFRPAIDAMLALGWRASLPEAVQARFEAGEEGEAVYATDRYAAWRARYMVPPPPPTGPIIVEACVVPGVSDNLTATLTSLSQQTMRCDSVVIAEAGALSSATATYRLHVASGTELHPHAVAWLVAAAERTGCAALCCDYEERDAAGELQPAFQPMFDPWWTAAPDLRPPLSLHRLQSGKGMALASASAAHLPLLLATRPRPARPPEVPPIARSPRDDVIQVVVQTRDEADALQASVESLIETAHRPDLLDIVVVDNRSMEPATTALLRCWQTRSVARTLPLDEPFNWARANNLAVANGTAPLLLFLNNDTETLTDGWDTALRIALASSSVGIVGALLLYPDRTVQHAGVVLGMVGGGPVHEGIGKAAAADELQARWRRNRLAAAVTGAWMGVHRTTFEALGGFDERLAVAFNDIDLCLRARAGRRHVLFCADIIALHHESLTRGLHLDPAAYAREQREYATLCTTWGPALQEDPALNPHWSRRGRPFDGLRYPEPKEVLAWLDQSARDDPWAIG